MKRIDTEGSSSTSRTIAFRLMMLTLLRTSAIAEVKYALCPLMQLSPKKSPEPRIIKRKAMVRLVEEDPSVSMRFINYLLLRNLRMEQNLIDHLFNSSEKRLARTLLLLARSGDGGKLPAIFDKINQDTLAEMVRTTRSRINFFMNKV